MQPQFTHVVVTWPRDGKKYTIRVHAAFGCGRQPAGDTQPQSAQLLDVAPRWQPKKVSPKTARDTRPQSILLLGVAKRRRGICRHDLWLLGCGPKTAGDRQPQSTQLFWFCLETTRDPQPQLRQFFAVAPRQQGICSYNAHMLGVGPRR